MSIWIEKNHSFQQICIFLECKQLSAILIQIFFTVPWFFGFYCKSDQTYQTLWKPKEHWSQIDTYCIVDKTDWIKSRLSGKLLKDHIDAQMFVVSSVLTLLHNIFRARLASMLTSILKHLNGSDPLMLEYSYLIFLKHSQISRIHMVLQVLFPEFLTRHLYMVDESMSQTFNVFATESDWFSLVADFHCLFYLECSSKALPIVGRSSLDSLIISSILLFLSTFSIPITDATKAWIL